MVVPIRVGFAFFVIVAVRARSASSILPVLMDQVEPFDVDEQRPIVRGAGLFEDSRHRKGVVLFALLGVEAVDRPKAVADLQTRLSSNRGSDHALFEFAPVEVTPLAKRYFSPPRYSSLSNMSGVVPTTRNPL